MSPKSLRRENWSKEEVKVLVDLWKEGATDIVEGKSSGLDFDIIHSKFNYYFSNGEERRSMKEIKVKVWNLKRQCKVETEKIKSDPHAVSTWPFYDMILEVLILDNQVHESKMELPESGCETSTTDESILTSVKPGITSSTRGKSKHKIETLQSAPKRQKTCDQEILHRNDVTLKIENDETPPSQQSEKDEFDFFGVYVASTLREMSNESALSLKNKINLLFFHENLNVSYESQKIQREVRNIIMPNKNNESPFIAGVGDEPWLMPSRSTAFIQGINEFKNVNGKVDSSLENSGPVNHASEDECDTFCKCISTQMKTLPLKSRVQCYADIQNVVAQSRVNSLTAD